jgi:hypothetical protein
VDLELEATINGNNRESFDSIGVRFRALEGSREVFLTSTRFAGIELPARGTIRCRISLRMCLPSGTYTVEPFAWRPGEDIIMSSGPISTCHMELDSSPLNRGTVDLSPQVSVTVMPNDLRAI